MLDTFVCVLAVSPSIPAAVSRFILDIPVLSQPPFPLLLGFVLLRMVYYPFFEIILRATPAKFLTGSYVVTTEGRKAGVPTIIKRTFARSIPFNAFSFLGSGRWHDRLSGTQVVSDVK